MLLSSDPIRFANPTHELIIKLFFAFDPAIMTKPSRRVLLDLIKARIFIPPGKAKATLQVGLARNDPQESHPNLKNDPKLLRDDGYLTAGTDQVFDPLAELEHAWLRTRKQGLQAESATRTPHISGDEFFATLGALPRFFDVRLLFLRVVLRLLFWLVFFHFFCRRSSLQASADF